MIRRYANRVTWMLILGGLAGLLAYGFTPPPLDIETAHPTVGSLLITVDDDGETRIREKYVISAPVTGKMLRVKLDPGDDVVAGETEIARINPSDPSLLDARTRAEAEARVQVATAAHTQSVAAIERATQSLELAKSEWNRAQKLIKNRAVSQADFDAAENRWRLAQADLRSAESAERVAGYEIDQARAAVAYITTKFDPDDGHLFQVISPIDGKVLEIYREDSGVVTSGTSLVRIGDAADLEIVIDILSTDAVKVRPGDQVIIDHWGGDDPLTAIVRLIEPSAFLKVSALGVEEKRVNVIADFVTPHAKRTTLGDGFRVEARIVVDQTAPSSLKVPAGCLFHQLDHWYAYRVAEGVAERIEVEIGRSNGIETEVRSGVQAGDVLVHHPPETIQTGTRVAF